MNILTTERLMLRELTIEDAGFILELTNDPEWLSNIGDRNVHDLNDAQNFILQGPISSYREHNFGMYAFCKKASENVEDSVPMGMCGLLQRDYLDRPDIGYATLPQYRRSGFTKEACIGVLTFSRDMHNIHSIFATVSPHNLDSTALLEKLGFSFLEQRILDGKDSLLYVISLD
jgi:RimJ/RimL family protein N-acetyltransferase